MERALCHRPANRGRLAGSEASDLDPCPHLDCAVIIDLEQHCVTFKVGWCSAEARRKESGRAIRYYGYLVEKTKTEFGPIEVQQAE